MAVRSLKDAVMKIGDSTFVSPTTGVYIEVALDAGDLSWTETHPINVILDRGTLDHARAGNDEPCQISFSALHTGMPVGNRGAGTAALGLYEILSKTGTASGYSSDEPNSDTWAMILEFKVTDPGGSDHETITFPRFHATEIVYTEGDPATILSVTGIAMVTQPTIS